MNQAGSLAYDVFVNDPPPQDGVLPNGEPDQPPGTQLPTAWLGRPESARPSACA
jgi:hypothetical protein